MPRAMYTVFLCPMDGCRWLDGQVPVAKFFAEGDGIAYVIWRASTNNPAGHCFELRDAKGYARFNRGA